MNPAYKIVFEVEMDPRRNIFMEAALSGHPVVVPDELQDKKPTTTKSVKRVKENDDRSTRRARELFIIKQALSNVGRLPAKVLRYVELMSYNLSEVDRNYYTNIGKPGGPSKDAALKRVSRRIKAM